ncbi:hypothetical protein Tco_1555471 [Tanacetum coccineum]
MMTYLKNMGGYKHSQLKVKSFEEIKGMYERQKKFVQDFVPIGSANKEELIKKMNEKEIGKDTSNKEKVLEEPDSTKVDVKQEGHEDSTRKIPGRRLKMKAIKKSKRLMSIEAMMEVRRIFKCWFYHHATNGHQFTMSNKHQELASPEQTASALAISEKMATGKEISNPFMAGRSDDEIPPSPPLQTPTQQAPHTVSTIKLPILKKDTNGIIKVLPPKTAEEILARERERKARTTLLMALPEDHLAKFYKMTDAKDMWDAIKSRFGGNDESKKMHTSVR